MFIIYSLVIFDSRLPFFFESIACYLLVSFCTFKFDNSDFSNWVIFIYLHIFFLYLIIANWIIILLRYWNKEKFILELFDFVFVHIKIICTSNLKKKKKAI